jgi:hypothetical protein
LQKHIIAVHHFWKDMYLKKNLNAKIKKNKKLKVIFLLDKSNNWFEKYLIFYLNFFIFLLEKTPPYL